MKRKALALCMAMTTLLASAGLMQATAAGEANTLPKLEGKMLDDGTKADKWIINGAPATAGDNCVEGAVSNLPLAGDAAPQGWMFYWSTGKDEGIDMSGYKYIAMDLYVSDVKIFGISDEAQAAQCLNLTNDYTGTKWDSYGSVNGQDFVDVTKDIKVGWNRLLFPLEKLTKGITYEDGTNCWSSENGVDITNVQYVRMLQLGTSNMPAEGANIKVANLMLTNGEEAGGSESQPSTPESQPSTPESTPESKPSPSTADATGPVTFASVAALAVLSLGVAVAVKKKSR